MSKHEWKPGDVAMVTVDGETFRAFRQNAGESVRTDWLWTLEERNGGVYDHYDRHGGVESVRPLVVIDPEDREAVERFDGLLSRFIEGKEVPDYEGTVGATQAALREFADPKPPRPDEPQGLGAVVEDADGDLFVRCVQGPSDAYWHCATNELKDERWPDIAAVTVHYGGWRA